MVSAGTVARCPRMVGRDAELAVIRAFTAPAVAVVGPPGIGKSRLVAELTGAIVGRAVPGASAAYRPLAEAFAGVLRGPDRPDTSELGAYHAVLGRILLDWRTATEPVDEPPWVIGEGVLRLHRILDAPLVAEDLHWADADTLHVIEYLVDNGSRVVVTLRDDPGPASELIDRLERRGRLRRLHLEPLSDNRVAEMITLCLGAPPHPNVLDDVLGRAGGTPLLVEELLAAGPSTDAVPAGVADLMATRLAALDDVARRCVLAASVLGERFDATLLPATTGASPDEVWAGLRAAGGIVEPVDPAHGGLFAFRHALTRDAVLAAQLPPERAAWAGRALAALRGRDPDLDGDAATAARLAEQAGDHAGAAVLLQRLGRADAARGGLASAEAVLRRADDLAEGRPHLQAEIEEVLADVLALAGEPAATALVTDRLLGRLQAIGAGHARLGAAQLRLARAWTAAGDWPNAQRAVDAARALTRSSPELGARVDVAEAQVAIGSGRTAYATAAARSALEATASDGPYEIACEALEVLGRAVRPHDLHGAEVTFERARALAEGHDLPLWQMRALHELSTIDTLGSLSLDRLDAAAELAHRTGAVAVGNVVALHRAGVLHMRGRDEEAVHAAADCAATARRLGLATLPIALLFEAEARCALGENRAARALAAEALSVRADPICTMAACATRATLALLAEDRTRAREYLDRGRAVARADPAAASPPTLGLAAVLGALDGSPIPEPAGSGATRWNAGLTGYARAITLGRAGRPDDAARAYAAADALLAGPPEIPFYRRLGRRLTAEAAAADGWGDPLRWLAEDGDWFDRHGHGAMAGACRGLLRRYGGRPRRRRTPGTTVPEPLRRAGVTGREMDVLRLVGDGLANAEIAARLVLSPRTVEKHVQRLLAKTGAASRSRLVAHAARLGER